MLKQIDDKKQYIIKTLKCVVHIAKFTDTNIKNNHNMCLYI